MNIQDRELLVRKGNVRSLYGGNYEPFFHAGMFIVFLWLYISYFSASDKFGVHIAMAGLMGVYLWSCVSYFAIAKVHCIGSANENSIVKTKEIFQSTGYIIKGSGKYFVEAYHKGSNVLIADTHVMVFEYEGSLYASAFRYGARGWVYVPFYFGLNKINEIKASVSF